MAQSVDIFKLFLVSASALVVIFASNFFLQETHALNLFCKVSKPQECGDTQRCAYLFANERNERGVCVPCGAAVTCAMDYEKDRDDYCCKGYACNETKLIGGEKQRYCVKDPITTVITTSSTTTTAEK